MNRRSLLIAGGVAAAGAAGYAGYPFMRQVAGGRSPVLVTAQPEVRRPVGKDDRRRIAGRRHQAALFEKDKRVSEAEPRRTNAQAVRR